MPVRRLLLATIVASSIVPLSARGQGSPVFTDTVVVTATGEERPLEETSAAVTVLEAADLQQAGTPALADALRRVPGAVLLRSGLDAGVVSLFLRGGNASHTLVLLDGVRLNSPFFGGYDFSLPLVATLERAEVVRGPYSAMYGGDAMGGVVQLVTRQPEGRPWTAMAEGGGGSWRRFEISTGFQEGPLGVSFALADRDGSGPLENDDFHGRVGLIRAMWQVGDTLAAGVLVHRADSRTGIPFSGAEVTPRRETESRETVVAAPLRWRWASGSTLELTPSRVERDLRFRDPDDPYGMVASDTVALSSGIQVAWRRTLGSHRVSLGGEWRRDEVDDSSTYGTTLDGRRLTTRALFFQDALSLGRNLELLAGGRWDEAPSWGSRFSPRATVAWREQSWRAWASVGEGFRAPALGELFYPLAGNPELRPERSRSAETGIAVTLPGRNSQVHLVGFASRSRDLVEFDFATYRFDNVALARQRGMEAAWRANLGSGVVQVSATWLAAEDGDGERLLRRPSWSGSLALRHPVGAVMTEAAVVWVGARPDVDPVSFTRVHQPAFVSANLGCTVPLGKVFAVRVRVENLADRAYEEVRGYPAPGRRVMAALLAAGR